MKKRKPSEQPSPDFKNNPFKSLKGFTPQPPSAPPPRKKSKKTEDDSDLFFRAVAGTRMLEHGDGHGVNPSEATREARATDRDSSLEQKDNDLFLQAMRNIGTGSTNVRKSSDEESSRDKPRSSSSRLRQLKRGTIHLSGELDLHGFLRDEAITKLEHFVSSAYARGREAVLVITGKGINSPEGPVLQGAVAAWLREQGKRMVAEFVTAPRELGGSGAFVLFLRKH